MKLFENRTLGFYLGLGAAALSLVTAIFYLIYTLTVGLFVPTIFVMMLLGAVSFAAVIFVDIKVLNVLPAIFYALAFFIHVADRVEMFAYMYSGIYGMGESGAILGIVIAILALSLISLV